MRQLYNKKNALLHMSSMEVAICNVNPVHVKFHVLNVTITYDYA